MFSSDKKPQPTNAIVRRRDKTRVERASKLGKGMYDLQVDKMKVYRYDEEEEKASVMKDDYFDELFKVR